MSGWIIGGLVLLAAVLVQVLKVRGDAYFLERDLNKLRADVARECYTLDELAGRHPFLRRELIVDVASEHGLVASYDHLEYPNGFVFSK